MQETALSARGRSQQMDSNARGVWCRGKDCSARRRLGLEV